ncbi:MAG: class I SAM-dependent methyltransferase [Gloeobacteraceae cyanobacterium ES-bin-144]|nr:class I SAM-dependent methyltransferase [Verrucomicrobiales bacterium]
MNPVNDVPPRPTNLAQMIIKERIHHGDVVIDATAGNGHDTVFLAECVGAGGRVLAFDVQAQAILSARQRAEAAGLAAVIDFHQINHARLAEYADQESVSAVMFNLGYLPGEDHELTTAMVDTLTALNAAASVLKPGGVISVICYPGHQAGEAEALAVKNWMTHLSAEGWRVAEYGLLGTLRPAPFLLVAAKR